MLAHSTINSGASHSRLGCCSRVATSHRSPAKIAIPNSWGRRASAGAASANASNARTAAVRWPAPRAIDVASGEPERHGDERRPGDREQLPAPGPVPEAEQDLRQPLLVGPGRARHGERPGVDARQRGRSAGSRRPRGPGMSGRPRAGARGARRGRAGRWRSPATAGPGSGASRRSRQPGCGRDVTGDLPSDTRVGVDWPRRVRPTQTRATITMSIAATYMTGGITRMSIAFEATPMIRTHHCRRARSHAKGRNKTIA